MKKFEAAVKNIMESLVINEAHDELDVDTETLEHEGILVSEVLPDDPEGDDVFILNALITMPYNVYKGEAQTWDSPGSDAEVEVADVIFTNVTLQRYSQKEDDYYTVTPEQIGAELYNSLMSRLKSENENLAVKYAYDNLNADDIISGDY